jgi:hypothetical protein
MDLRPGPGCPTENVQPELRAMRETFSCTVVISCNTFSQHRVSFTPSDIVLYTAVLPITVYEQPDYCISISWSTD